MTCPWREQPAPLLEQHCNPRVAVPHFQEALERYAARSAAARQRLPGFYDLRYGSRPQQTSLHFSQVAADGHEHESPPNRLASVHARSAKTVRRDTLAPPGFLRDTV